MSAGEPPPLEPWAARPAPAGTGSVSLEDQVAALFRRVEVPARFDPHGDPDLRPLRRESGRPPTRLRYAALVGLGALLGSSGIVVAAKGIPPLGRWLIAPAPHPAPAPAPSAPARQRRAAGHAPAAAEASATPAIGQEAPAPAPLPSTPAPPSAAAPALAAPAPQAGDAPSRPARPPARPERAPGSASPPARDQPAAPAPARGAAHATEPGPALDRTPAPDRAPAAAQPPVPLPVAPPVAAVPAPVVAVPPPASSALARETRLLGPALAALRRDRDPRAALEGLTGYLAAFPGGVLRREADVARVEALLLLGRKREALGVLEELPPGHSDQDRELSLVRGELRASDDCARALADFAAVLAAPLPPPLAERALFGQAACRARLGRPDAAASLRAYLDRFPRGRFAAEARRRLDRK
jgi:hypothetical protein